MDNQEAKKQSEKDRDSEIRKAKSHIADELLLNAKYEEAVMKFFAEFEKEFPGKFFLERLDDSKAVKEFCEYKYDENCDAVIGPDGKHVRDVYFKKRYRLRRFQIRCVACKNACKNVRIIVCEHHTRSGRRSYSFSKNLGFKMRLLGIGNYSEERRHLTSIRTIEKKISELLEQEVRTARSIEISKIGNRILLEKLKAVYGKCARIGISGGVASVEFKNGLTAEFSYHFKCHGQDDDVEEIASEENFELLVSDIDFNSLDQFDVVNFLRHMPKAICLIESPE